MQRGREGKGFVRNSGLPSGELTYPTLGKGKSSSKCHFLGDMLVFGGVDFFEFTLWWTNIAGWKIHHLTMYSLLEKENFQPAMLVYWRVWVYDS